MDRKADSIDFSDSDSDCLDPVFQDYTIAIAAPNENQSEERKFTLWIYSVKQRLKIDRVRRY